MKAKITLNEHGVHRMPVEGTVLSGTTLRLTKGHMPGFETKVLVTFDAPPYGPNATANVTTDGGHMMGWMSGYCFELRTETRVVGTGEFER